MKKILLVSVLVAGALFAAPVLDDGLKTQSFNDELSCSHSFNRHNSHYKNGGHYSHNQHRGSHHWF